jgi:3-phosphoshikimate 1-carboxyvinyltransferase
MSDLTIRPVTAPFRATITPPGSKSLTNRALVLAALADGQSALSNTLFADDTRVMTEGLAGLGFRLDVDEADGRIRLEGGGGVFPREEADLFCGNSGTTLRFLTALCALGNGRYRLDGTARMRERPVGQLGEMLERLGARITYPERAGYPPLVVQGDGLAGGRLRFGRSPTSQFLSALLMVAPYAREAVRIDLDGPQTSWPYVRMTAELMGQFGVSPVLVGDAEGERAAILVPRARYLGTDYAVEADASSASYLLAMAALHAGAEVTVRGLGEGSLQGDAAFARVLERMGAEATYERETIRVCGTGRLLGIEVDLGDMPDMAQTLAVVAVFAQGPTVIGGLHTLPLKETDRLAALVSELSKLGADARADRERLTIVPPQGGVPTEGAVEIDTYDDHRMAMSFALAGTVRPEVTIRDVECVRKTYPNFFEDLERVIRSKRQ